MHLSSSGTLQHVSVGCNRIVGALSWSDTDVIAYAAHNAIIVADPNSSRVLASLLGHTDIVNCVRWFPSLMHPQAATNNFSAVLASGSADKAIKIWLWSPSSSPSSSPSWSCAATLQGNHHSAAISSITLHHNTYRNDILLISTSGDGSVCIWQNNNNNITLPFASWHLRQKLQLPRPETALCAAISSPPPSTNTNTSETNNDSNNTDSWLILALGCIDGTVSLWVAAPQSDLGEEGEGGEFKKACKLQGHQDWIRGLDFIHIPSDTTTTNNNNNKSDSTTSQGPRLLLASASQDKYVRIWSIRRGEPTVPSSPVAAVLDGSNSSIVAQLSKYAPRPIFNADGMCSAVLEALLVGHEDWVHSVQWKPQGGGGTKKPCLISSSMDRTMMLWEPDVATGKIYTI